MPRHPSPENKWQQARPNAPIVNTARSVPVASAALRRCRATKPAHISRITFMLYDIGKNIAQRIVFNTFY